MQKSGKMNRNTELVDYAAMRGHCEVAGRITENLIDGFLVSFAAKRYDLEKKMELQFNRYRHVFSKFAKSDVNLFKTQYIAHRIFKEGGILEKILKHPALNRLSVGEREFLELQTKTPWRFSFSEMISEPDKDFFRMRDVFTEEEYLLFSRGTSRLKAEGPKLLWLNLIGFNGACWQSFGPIGAFQSFDADDVFFFATEKNHDIDDSLQVKEDMDADPIPYVLLISGAAYPRTISKGFETVIMMTEVDSEAPDSTAMKKKFTVEYNQDVYRYTHKKLGEFPHFAEIYFDEKEKVLLLQAMTEYGFQHLIRDFNALGHDISDIALIRVRMQLVTTAESILNRKITINEYDNLFRKDPEPVKTRQTDQLNEFFRMVTPALNEGREPDIEAAVRKTGVDPETAAELVQSLRKVLSKYDQPELPEEKQKPAAKQSIPRKKSPKQTTPEQSSPHQSPSKQSTPRQNTPQLFSPSQILPAHLPQFPADWYGRIYTAAGQICDLEPWTDHYETDIFGVRMPGSGLTWYISVMGNNGEYTAIAAYRDIEGLWGFYGLQENDGISQAMELMTVPHLLISFTDREELDKADLSAIKKSGVAFRGKGRWPKIEEVVPGFVPEYPGGATFSQLPDLLEQVYLVLQEAKSNPRILSGRKGRKDEILVRVPRVSARQLQWKNSFEEAVQEVLPVIYKPIWKPQSAVNLSKLKIRKVTLQCGLSLLPAPVKTEGKKGYFPFVLLLVDKDSGMIPGMAMLSPLPDLHSMYETFPQKLLDEILKLGFRPASVELRSELLFDLAGEILEQAGCPVVLTEHMPLMDEALESLFKNFGR
jgi:hypothetical protein